jgi:CRP-like cAMP-binding protein
LGVLGSGDFFGEAMLPDDRPSNAMVRALTTVQVMALDRGTFRTMVEDSEATSQQITERTLDRLAGLVQKYAEYGPSIDDSPEG